MVPNIPPYLPTTSYLPTIATLYFGEIGVCSICCRKLVIAQKYSSEVRPNFGTRSAQSAKISVSAEHYKGMLVHL